MTILVAKLTMTAFVIKVNRVYLVAIGAYPEFFIGIGMTSGHLQFVFDLKNYVIQIML